MRITAFAQTDVGKVRPENEDDFYVGQQVFAVADGMGGHAAGEVAAKTALEPLIAIDGQSFESAESAEEALIDALRQANREVVEKAEADPDLQGMGTTLTAGLLRDDRLHLAHVGDSRAYLLRDGEAITQLTTDHTLVERLVRDGRLSRAEAATHPQRNVITRAIGNEPDVVVDSLPALRLQAGDQVLLCSDGLTGPLGDAEIAAALERNPDGDAAVTDLITAANEAGGPDNVTAVLLRVEGEEGDTTAAPDRENIRVIRTREDGDPKEWANRLGSLGAAQGDRSRGRSRGGRGPGRGKRAVAVLLAILLLVGIVMGGGWMLLSRAYFVGAHEGQVAIFRGVPEDVWNVPLYRVIDGEVTDLDLDDFPEWRQQQIENGIGARTIGEARGYVDNLGRTIDDGSRAGDDDPGDEDAGTGANDEGAGAANP